MLTFTSMTTTPKTSTKTVEFELMKGFPTTEQGIEQGVSACFAGVISDKMIIAGGCNFPETPAAKGGKKRYYQGIYAATIDNSNVMNWQHEGNLPEPCAYGTTIQLDDAILCIGGQNDNGTLSSVWKISIKNDRIITEELPSLPYPMDNFTGSRLNNDVVVCNGKYMCLLNIDDIENGWQTTLQVDDETLGQPVSAFINGVYYLWGGVTPKTTEKDAVLNIDGWRFGSTVQTSKAPRDKDNNPIYLGGAAMINLDNNSAIAVGGVNKDVFINAVNNPHPDYMTQPIDWYKFNKNICLFKDDHWTVIGNNSITARAGASLVKHNNDIYIIGGELKPGIRTPQIHRINIK